MFIEEYKKVFNLLTSIDQSLKLLVGSPFTAEGKAIINLPQSEFKKEPSDIGMNEVEKTLENAGFKPVTDIKEDIKEESKKESVKVSKKATAVSPKAITEPISSKPIPKDPVPVAGISRSDEVKALYQELLATGFDKQKLRDKINDLGAATFMQLKLPQLEQFELYVKYHLRHLNECEKAAEEEDL